MQGGRSMTILVVDHNPESLCRTQECIRTCSRTDQVTGFADAAEAMNYIREHDVDILFTEVMMPGETGFSLTRVLKSRRPGAYVIFVTDSPDYAMCAWQAHVNGYLLKPVDVSKIKNELQYAVVDDR